MVPLTPTLFSYFNDFLWLQRWRVRRDDGIAIKISIRLDAAWRQINKLCPFKRLHSQAIRSRTEANKMRVNKTNNAMRRYAEGITLIKMRLLHGVLCHNSGSLSVKYLFAFIKVRLCVRHKRQSMAEIFDRDKASVVLWLQYVRLLRRMI